MRHFQVVLAIAVLVGSDNLRAGFAVGMLGGRRRDLVRAAVLFGAAESLMPVVGASLGAAFVLRSETLTSVVGPVALCVCGCLVAFQMTRPAGVDDRLVSATSWSTPILLGLDNLAAGVTLASLDVPLALGVSSVAVISSFLALLGLYLGHRLGDLLQGHIGVWHAAVVVVVTLGAAVAQISA